VNKTRFLGTRLTDPSNWAKRWSLVAGGGVTTRAAEPEYWLENISVLAGKLKQRFLDAGLEVFKKWPREAALRAIVNGFN
jgi:hypothetical protein